MLDENAPRRLLFVSGALWVLAGLSFCGAFLAWLATSFDKSADLNAALILVFAHAALPLLSLLSCVGLIFRRRWAWWTGLSAFGLLASMASFVLVLCVWPGHVSGVDPECWPLAAVYTVCAFPGALMFGPGRVYRDYLR